MALTGDERLAALLRRGQRLSRARPRRCTAPAARSPCRCGYDAGGRELAFFSTIATFGTAVDITLAELAIEAFFPADETTAAYLMGN